jgi:hypothetical protein
MKTFVADFETTVETDKTRVWAYGMCEVGNIENFLYGNNIIDFIEWCKKENRIVYFHNLKFDGEFIIHWLLTNGYTYSEQKLDKTFSGIISNMGQFYEIEIIFEKKNKRYKKVTFRDSYKKLPFTVKKIAQDFGLPIAKGDLDYKLLRPEGWLITDAELVYLKNDVQIVAMALGIQFEQGLTKMTVGSDALANFTAGMGKEDFKRTFPVLPIETDSDIRRAYRGGFTYVADRYKGKDIKEGVVFDVNSLYPSVMYDKLLPFGLPLPFSGRYEFDEYYPLHIQRLICEFTVKEGHIPTIQLKDNLAFKSTEYIRESGLDPVELTLSNVDLDLFFEHYDVYVHEWVNGWKFKACEGLFKDYIDFWMNIKENSEGAIRLLAKLMLNSLYGKFATNPDVTGKYPILEDGHVRYIDKEEEFRDPVYTAMGLFITSYARELTIRTAQSVYDRFIYADTDSIHLEGADVPSNIEVHKSKLGAWKYEGTFTRARFVRAKTYIEEIEGKLHVTCAGMPDNVKKFVIWENFRPINMDMYLPARDGYYFGKLRPKHVEGGIVLEDTDFTIR